MKETFNGLELELGNYYTGRFDSFTCIVFLTHKYKDRFDDTSNYITFGNTYLIRETEIATSKKTRPIATAKSMVYRLSTPSEISLYNKKLKESGMELIPIDTDFVYIN